MVVMTKTAKAKLLILHFLPAQTFWVEFSESDKAEAA